jgi:hypothetical protein
VKVTPEGKVKVLDFGLAKALTGDASSPDQTRSPTLTAAATQAGVVIGTAAQVFATFQGGELSRSTGQLWYFTFSYAVAGWVEMDRKERSIRAPFEYSAFMFFIWPVLAPYYLFRSRRWRGFALGIGLIILASVPDLAAIAVYYLSGDEW